MQSRFVRWCAAATLTALVGLSFAACTGGAQEVVPASGTPQVTLTPTEEPTDTPSPTATAAAPTATPTPTPEVTQSPTPGPGNVCFGSQDNKDFFTDAAHALKVQVYCAGALPAHWWLQSGNHNKGILTIEYKKTGASAIVREGPLTPALLVVPQAGSFIASVPFGDKSGDLGLQDGSYYLQVEIGGSVVYQMTAPQAIGEANMRWLAAHMVLVPKA